MIKLYRRVMDTSYNGKFYFLVIVQVKVSSYTGKLSWEVKSPSYIGKLYIQV